MKALAVFLVLLSVSYGWRLGSVSTSGTLIESRDDKFDYATIDYALSSDFWVGDEWDGDHAGAIATDADGRFDYMTGYNWF